MYPTHLTPRIDSLMRQGRSYYKPWIGSKYQEGGLLFLSESAYCWETGHPRPSHPTKHTVEYTAFNCFATRGFRYVTAVTRALCRSEWPAAEGIRNRWNQIAYSIYVQRPLPATTSRPAKIDFLSSGRPFLQLIDDLKPNRVVITGYQTWEQMPETAVVETDFKQAYRRHDGGLAWCLAVPHVQSRKPNERFNWQEIGRTIEAFERETLARD